MRVLLLCGLLAAVSAEKATPIQNAIKQLKKMVQVGNNEKAQEQKMFAAFNQWCDDMRSDKDREISEGNEDIENFESIIAKSKATIEKMTGEIDQHNKDLDDSNGDVKAATNVRGIEVSDFQKMLTDYTESIDALQDAIATLKNVDKVVRQRQEEGTKSAVYQTLLQLQTKLQTNDMIPAEAKAAIMAFIQSSRAARDDGDDADDDNDLDEEYKENMKVRSVKANAYEPKVGKVIDLLAELLGEFDKKREDLTAQERQTKFNYEALMQELSNIIDMSTTQIADKTSRRAKASERLAEGNQNLEAAQKELAADSAYLETWDSSCKMKGKEFEQRQALRDEELDTLGRVIEILSSNAVAGKAAHLQTSFLQISSHPTSTVMIDVAEYLTSRATAIHSSALSQLATAVGTGADPFEKVRDMIQGLIVQLTKEAGEEAKQKAWCDKELKTNKMDRQERTNNVADLQAEIEELTANIAKLEGEIAEHSQNLADIAKSRKEAASQRQDEHDDNETTIRDAQEGQRAIALAMQVLKDFYDEAGGATALLQGGDTPPPETWDTSYTGMQSMQGGVQGMLEVIMSDFARQETDTKTMEAEQVSSFDKFVQESDLDRKANQQDEAFKTQKKQSDEEAHVRAKADLDTESKLLEEANTYYDKLKPPCVVPKVDFSERTKMRTEEVEALQEALSILTGQANNEGGANLA